MSCKSVMCKPLVIEISVWPCRRDRAAPSHAKEYRKGCLFVLIIQLFYHCFSLETWFTTVEAFRTLIQRNHVEFQFRIWNLKSANRSQYRVIGISGSVASRSADQVFSNAFLGRWIVKPLPGQCQLLKGYYFVIITSLLFVLSRIIIILVY